MCYLISGMWQNIFQEILIILKSHILCLYFEWNMSCALYWYIQNVLFTYFIFHVENVEKTFGRAGSARSSSPKSFFQEFLIILKSQKFSNKFLKKKIFKKKKILKKILKKKKFKKIFSKKKKNSKNFFFKKFGCHL
jgi:hypothetical protein